MPAPPKIEMRASCACSRVKVLSKGTPIVTAVCYCRDCQQGSRQIEALPGARAVRDPDGGTAYILFRKDRIGCSEGASLLKGYKINEASVTSRVVATCCDSAMFMNFDKGPHWISAYRARFERQLPSLQMRIFAKQKAVDVILTTEVPIYPGFPLRLIPKLLGCKIAMMLGR
jgi:hypothetical protein